MDWLKWYSQEYLNVFLLRYFSLKDSYFIFNETIKNLQQYPKFIAEMYYWHHLQPVV